MVLAILRYLLWSRVRRQGVSLPLSNPNPDIAFDVWQE